MKNKLKIGLAAALVAAFLVALQACKDGSGEAPVTPHTPAGLVKTPTDTQSAPVGTPVPFPPGITAEDSADLPIAGVEVTFAIVSGGGRVNRGVDTTDANGAAHVGAWILGTSAGTNVLSASAGPLKVYFTANGVAGAVSALVKVKGDLATGTVGSAVNPAPTVRAVDGFGNPIAGLAVVFTVIDGEGSITGATPTTDNDGIAALGSWTLGTKAGFDTVVAAAAQLAPTAFAAIATPGSAEKVLAALGDGQTASISGTLPIRPTVQVLDGYGNPVPNMSVTFQVTSGGGQIQGATPLTDTTGFAAVGAWVLGPTPGSNTMSATVQGLAPVTFTATGVDYCAESIPYAIGTTASGTLNLGLCAVSPGSYENYYATSVSAPQLVTFTMVSTSFHTSLSLLDSGRTAITSASDYCQDPYSWYYGCYFTSSSVAFTALLGPGAYTVGTGSTDSGATGSYTLSSTSADPNVTGCGTVWIARTISTSQRIDTSDCETPFHGAPYYSDDYSVNLIAGRTYTITMASTDFDTYLELVGPGQSVSNDDYGGTTNSQIVYAPTATGAYSIVAGTYVANQTGAYTLTVSEQGAAGSGPALRATALGPSRAAPRRAARLTPPRPSFHPRPPKGMQLR